MSTEKFRKRETFLKIILYKMRKLEEPFYLTKVRVRQLYCIFSYNYDLSVNFMECSKLFCSCTNVFLIFKE